MPIGQWGLESDAQIAQSKAQQGQAMMQGAQALGGAISQAPQQMATMQLHEFQKQELATKIQLAAQVQGIHQQDLNMRMGEYQLAKDKFEFEKQHQTAQEDIQNQHWQDEFAPVQYHPSNKTADGSAEPGNWIFGGPNRELTWRPMSAEAAQATEAQFAARHGGGRGVAQDPIKIALSAIEERRKIAMERLKSANQQALLGDEPTRAQAIKDQKRWSKVMDDLDAQSEQITVHGMGGAGPIGKTDAPTGTGDPVTSKDAASAMAFHGYIAGNGLDFDKAFPVLRQAQTDLERKGMQPEQARMRVAAELKDPFSPLSRWLRENAKSIQEAQAAEPPPVQRQPTIGPLDNIHNTNR